MEPIDDNYWRKQEALHLAVQFTQHRLNFTLQETVEAAEYLLGWLNKVEPLELSNEQEPSDG